MSDSGFGSLFKLFDDNGNVGLWGDKEAPSPLMSDQLMEELNQQKQEREALKRARLEKEKQHPVSSFIFDTLTGQKPNIFQSQEEEQNQPDLASWAENLKSGMYGAIEHQYDPIMEMLSAPKTGLDEIVSKASEQGYIPKDLGLVNHPGNEAGQLAFNIASGKPLGKLLGNEENNAQAMKDYPVLGNVNKFLQTTGEGVGGMSIDPTTLLLPEAPGSIFAPGMVGQALTGIQEGTPEGYANALVGLGGLGLIGHGHIEGDLVSDVNRLIGRGRENIAPYSEHVYDASEGYHNPNEPSSSDVKETIPGFPELPEGAYSDIPLNDIPYSEGFHEGLTDPGSYDYSEHGAVGNLVADRAKGKGKFKELGPIPENNPLEYLVPEDPVENTGEFKKRMEEKNKTSIDAKALENLTRNPATKRALIEMGVDPENLSSLGRGYFHEVFQDKFGEGDTVTRVSTHEYDPKSGERAVEWPDSKYVIKPKETRFAGGKQIDIVPALKRIVRPSVEQVNALKAELAKEGKYKLVDENTGNLTVIGGKARVVDPGAIVPIEVADRYEASKGVATPEAHRARLEMQNYIRRKNAGQGRNPFSGDLAESRSLSGKRKGWGSETGALEIGKVGERPENSSELGAVGPDPRREFAGYLYKKYGTDWKTKASVTERKMWDRINAGVKPSALKSDQVQEQTNKALEGLGTKPVLDSEKVFSKFPKEKKQQLEQLLDLADESLSLEAESAIQDFVGHVPKSRGSAVGGIMAERRLEDAMSDNPSKEGLNTRKQLEESFSPIREKLREDFGDNVDLFRVQGKVPEGKQRNVLSYSLDENFAKQYAGVTKEGKVYSPENIDEFQNVLNQTGEVVIGNKKLRKNEYGSLDILDKDGSVITDTDSVQDYVKDLNKSSLLHKQANTVKSEKIGSHKVSLDDVVWATNRAGQWEFIVKNNKLSNEPINVDPLDYSSEAPVSVEPNKGPGRPRKVSEPIPLQGNGNNGNKPPKPPGLNTKPIEPESTPIGSESKTGLIQNPIVRGLNAVKSLAYGGDVGHLLRQGKQLNSDLLLSTNPKRDLKAFADQFKVMFKSGKIKTGEQFVKDFHEKLYSDPDIKVMVDKFGLDLPGVGAKNLKEEVFHGGGLAEELPVVGKYYAKPSERIYTTGLNYLRSTVVKNEMSYLKEKGLTPEKNPEAYRSVSRAINIIGQRGDFSPAYQKAFNDLSVVLGAPRAKAARLQNIFSGDLVKNTEAGRIQRRTMLKTVATNAALFGILKAKYGKDIDFVTDPESSDFLKMRKGKVTVDPWMGLGPTFRTAMKIYYGRNKSGVTGKVTKVSPGEAVGNEFMNGIAPGIALVWTLASGKDTRGYLKDRSSAFENLIPLPGRSAKEIYDTEGLDGLLLAILDNAGTQVNAFDPVKARKEQNRIKKERSGNKGIYSDEGQGLYQ